MNDIQTSPTSATRRRSRPAKWAIGGLVAIAGVGTATYVAAASNTNGRHDRTITFDVAENGTRFAFDPAPVFDDGMPAYGNDFVTEGLIFEPGTLDDSVGFDAAGNVLPEVADKVIGEWKCFGFMIGDGAHTESGEWVVSTQTYRFYGDDGRTTDDDVIVSTGTEHVPGEPVVRAVTGGTGTYATARGEVHQFTTGFGENMGVLAEFTVELARR
jgi:hypothetical protein